MKILRKLKLIILMNLISNPTCFGSSNSGADEFSSTTWISITEAFEEKIYRQFYTPEEKTVSWCSFGVFDLLRKHRPQFKTSDHVRLIALYSESLQNIDIFRYEAEKSKGVEALYLDQKTSFLFYLSLLTFLRDIDLTVFKKYHVSAKNFVQGWAGEGQTQNIPLSDSIIHDLINHKKEYFEILAKRFVKANGSLETWNNTPTQSDPLGNYQDHWNDIIFPELQEFRRQFPGSFKNRFEAYVAHVQTSEKQKNSDKIPSHSKGFRTQLHLVLPAQLLQHFSNKKQKIVGKKRRRAENSEA